MKMLRDTTTPVEDFLTFRGSDPIFANAYPNGLNFIQYLSTMEDWRLKNVKNIDIRLDELLPKLVNSPDSLYRQYNRRSVIAFIKTLLESNGYLPPRTWERGGGTHTTGVPQLAGRTTHNLLEPLQEERRMDRVVFAQPRNPSFILKKLSIIVYCAIVDFLLCALLAKFVRKIMPSYQKGVPLEKSVNLMLLCINLAIVASFSYFMRQLYELVPLPFGNARGFDPRRVMEVKFPTSFGMFMFFGGIIASFTENLMGVDLFRIIAKDLAKK